MLKKALFAAAVVILAASTAFVQTDTSEQGILDFMGWRKGSWWDYSCRGIGGKSYREKWSVSSVRSFKKGAAVIMKKLKNGVETSHTAYLVVAPRVHESYQSDEDLWIEEIEGSEQYNASLLKFPLVEGAEWGGPLEIPEGKVLAAKKRLKTPAGSFRDCVEVNQQFEDGNTVYSICPGVGIVKQEGYIAGYKGRETMTLRRYKIPQSD